MLLEMATGTFGRTVFVEKYDRWQISKLQTMISALLPGQPKFCLGKGLLAPDENFNYGSLEKLFPYKFFS